MTPREIVAEAWAIATRERQLWWWGFVESFFQTLLNIKLLGYQAYFIYAYSVGKEVGLADDFILLYEYTNLTVTIIAFIIFLILLGIEFLMPHFTEGAIIGLAAKSYRGEPMRGGFVFALYNFFPLFALHELFVLGGWATALTAVSMSLRYLPWAIAFPSIFIIIGIWIFTNILRFFASFAEQGIVIKKQGIFESITRSYKLILSHTSHIMFLLLLLFVISLRVIINAIVILVVPAIAIGIGLLLTYVFSPTISYTVGTLLAVGLVVLVSYFLSYLHVFRQVVWTLMYIELDKHKDLDAFE